MKKKSFHDDKSASTDSSRMAAEAVFTIIFIFLIDPYSFRDVGKKGKKCIFVRIILYCLRISMDIFHVQYSYTRRRAIRPTINTTSPTLVRDTSNNIDKNDRYTARWPALFAQYWVETNLKSRCHVQVLEETKTKSVNVSWKCSSQSVSNSWGYGRRDRNFSYPSVRLDSDDLSSRGQENPFFRSLIFHEFDAKFFLRIRELVLTYSSAL